MLASCSGACAKRRLRELRRLTQTPLQRPGVIAVNRPWLPFAGHTPAATAPRLRNSTRSVPPGIRGPYRSFCAGDNGPIVDRLVLVNAFANHRFVPRPLSIARCVLLHHCGFARRELLRGVLAGPALNRQERFPFH